MIRYFAFVFLFLIFTNSTSASEAQPITKKVSPIATQFQIEGRPINLEFLNRRDQLFENMGAAPAIYGPTRYVIYNSMNCAASWDETCDGSYTLTAPEGFQACNILYNITYQDGEDKWVNYNASDWYTNDPASPDRFRSFTLYIHAGGTKDFIRHRGSEIRISDVGLTILPASASNYDRYAAGCTMPAHD